MKYLSRTENAVLDVVIDQRRGKPQALAMVEAAKKHRVNLGKLYQLYRKFESWELKNTSNK